MHKPSLRTSARKLLAAWTAPLHSTKPFKNIVPNMPLRSRKTHTTVCNMLHAVVILKCCPNVFTPTAQHSLAAGLPLTSLADTMSYTAPASNVHNLRNGIPLITMLWGPMFYSTCAVESPTCLRKMTRWGTSNVDPPLHTSYFPEFCFYRASLSCELSSCRMHGDASLARQTCQWKRQLHHHATPPRGACTNHVHCFPRAGSHTQHALIPSELLASQNARRCRYSSAKCVNI